MRVLPPKGVHSADGSVYRAFGVHLEKCGHLNLINLAVLPMQTPQQRRGVQSPIFSPQDNQDHFLHVIPKRGAQPETKGLVCSLVGPAIPQLLPLHNQARQERGVGWGDKNTGKWSQWVSNGKSVLADCSESLLPLIITSPGKRSNNNKKRAQETPMERRQLQGKPGRKNCLIYWCSHYIWSCLHIPLVQLHLSLNLENIRLSSLRRITKSICYD